MKAIMIYVSVLKHTVPYTCSIAAASSVCDHFSFYRYNFLADEKSICPPLPGHDLIVLALHACTRGVLCVIWTMSVFDYGLVFSLDGHL